MSHSQQVAVRFCKFELSGESNIYVCARDEYCCNIGCCISPTFQFYQLWYYWFMVFFMFLVCSGGQWWYRYVMQGRCASAIAPPARRASYPRQARVAYTPARDTVVLHHLWKPSYSGPGMNGPPPSYSQSGSSSSSGCSLVGPKPSPYMQLYGPPPSYESVIASGPAPAPVHSFQGDGGPSENHPVVQQRRSNVPYHLQPLELHHVNPCPAEQQSTSHNQPLIQQQQLSSLTLLPPSQAQQEAAPHLHQNAVGSRRDEQSPSLPLAGPQQTSSSSVSSSQIP